MTQKQDWRVWVKSAAAFNPYFFIPTLGTYEFFLASRYVERRLMDESLGKGVGHGMVQQDIFNGGLGQWPGFSLRFGSIRVFASPVGATGS